MFAALLVQILKNRLDRKDMGFLVGIRLDQPLSWQRRCCATQRPARYPRSDFLQYIPMRSCKVLGTRYSRPSFKDVPCFFFRGSKTRGIVFKIPGTVTGLPRGQRRRNLFVWIVSAMTVTKVVEVFAGVIMEFCLV